MNFDSRYPLSETSRHNNFRASSTVEKRSSPDLEQLARELKINDNSRRTDIFRSKFETNSAIVSSFKTTDSKSTLLTDRTVLRNDLPLSELQLPHNPKEAPGYQYLCRVEAIKYWLEAVLQVQIPQSSLELLTYIRNGIYLAKLANKFLPNKRSIFKNDSRLDFRHTENIISFFRLLHHLNFPSLFYFELTDLFEAKNIPKVWYCLHALSYKINTIDPDCPLIQNTIGLIQFPYSDVVAANRMLMGRQLPGFSSIDIDCFTSPKKNSFVNKTLNLSAPIETYGSLSGYNVFEARKTDATAPAKLIVPKNKLDNLIPMATKHGMAKDLDITTEYPHQTKNAQLCERSAFLVDLKIDSDLIIKLQALSRGSLLRFRMFANRIMLRSYGPELHYFVCIVRGYLARSRSFRAYRKEVKVFEAVIMQLQSMLRGFLLRSDSRLLFFEDQKMDFLKAILRLRLLKLRNNQLLIAIEIHRNEVVVLQSLARSRIVVKVVGVIMDHQEFLEPLFLTFQSIVKGASLRMKIKDSERSCSDDLLFREFQAIVKGSLARNTVRAVLSKSFRNRRSIVEFQAVFRGAICRTILCNGVLVSLIGEDFHMNGLFAKIRKNLVTATLNKDHCSLFESTRSICQFQSKFRGILLRYNLELQGESLYENIESVIEAQSLIRAKVVHKSLLSFQEYYRKKESEIIRAQTLLKRFSAQSAYQSLINKKDPPLSVIRKFSHLFVDQAFDLSEELRLTEYKDQIMDLSRQNKELEQQIDNLDIKLALLDKSMISTDELLALRKNFATFKLTYESITEHQTSKNLNPSVKRTLDLYLSLFYLLQTNPIYFTRYFSSIRPKSLEELAILIDLVMSIYPLNNVVSESSAREEYFLVKSIFSWIEADYAQKRFNIADITKVSQSLWIHLFLKINSHTRYRNTLISVFGKKLKLLWEDEDISFESDPSKIHSHIRQKEIKIHGTSNKPIEIHASDAITIEDVSKLFVRNLMQLRDYADEFLSILRLSIPEFPLHVRLIAKETYRLSKINFPGHPEDMHISVSGVVVMKHYISSILRQPELHGFRNRSSSRRKIFCNSDNFLYLNRVLLQVFSMRPFKDDFMKPLNDFVLSHADTVKSIVTEIIDVKEPDIEYKVNDLDDLVASEKPMLTIHVRDMINLDKMIRNNIQVFAPDMNDQLRVVVNQINEIHCSTEEVIQLEDLGNYTLSLTPIGNVDTIDESRKQFLISQAKFYLLYLISVQQGENLLELFIQGISPDHEKTFQDLKRRHERWQIQDSESVTSRSIVKEIRGHSFAELKQKLLKVVLRLEHMGEIDRRNSYQELTNQLVSDIKTKGQQRDFRRNQIRLSVETIARLNKKKHVLQNRLRDYKSHMNQMMESMQLKPKERKVFNIIPLFSKQYFYHRLLKKNNCLPKFGSYIHSAKRLVDQGVIRSVGKSFAQKSLGSAKLEFKFSCHVVGIFTVEAAFALVNIPGARDVIILDDVLDRQHENIKDWPLFDDLVVFDTENFAALIFKHFYEVNFK